MHFIIITEAVASKSQQIKLLKYYVILHLTFL